ncbi:DUF1194 domain-containing protein [Methylobacterium aquaticum]|uniref:DUF1194 domain-containing protein n=1 Tax=Methylobacterium aquaticum TaxID=270351 RepID=A0A0J6SIF7_9HYPH|nr:DUF1194 domain-containing protein [Methylobacterium aquaticum]KMO33477.1 hypothetical protein VP06_16140 [Methylobacterium aquaticum]
MRSRIVALFACLLVAGAAGPPVRAGGDPVEVDVALVLAVDVSLSMTGDEQAVQREGYVEAFRNPAVHHAIRQGMVGRIAVTYVEWAGVGNQRVVVPWTLIAGPEEATGFADRLGQSPPRRSTWTSIASAIDFSAGLLAGSGFEATRRVIDVSGDGPNNQGRSVTKARDDAVRQGIVINGLPLMIREPSGPWDIKDLDLYYRDCVIGGSGSFMVPVRERDQFAAAIRTKIIREVAAQDGSPPEGTHHESGPGETGPLVLKAQGEPRANCLVGERPNLDWD